MTERWKRREKKLHKRKNQMPIHGMGLKKVILPIIGKKAEEAKKKEETK